MPTVRVEADVAWVDVERLVGAVPELIARLRGLTFDPDGVVRLPTGRREGLRLLAGSAGAPGARYRMVTRPAPSESVDGPDPAFPATDPPVEIEVLTDAPAQLQLVASGPEHQSRVTLDQPGQPERLHVDGNVVIPDLPAQLGRHLEGSLVVQLAGFGTASEPQVTADAVLGRVTGRVTVHLRPGSSGAVQPMTVEVRFALRGWMRPLTVAWPFVRQRFVAAVRTEMVSVVAQIRADLDRLLVGGGDPGADADRLMAELLDGLAERVPPADGG